MSKLEEFKTAAQLAQEQDPELHKFIYCYLDKAVQRFTPIFVRDEEPKFMVDGIQTAIKKGMQTKELTGLQLCFCGTFELKEGKFDLFDKPDVLLDCDVVIERFGGSDYVKVA